MKNKIHYNLFKKGWTSHTYKYCSNVETVLVKGDWMTEVKPNYKCNPRGWVFCDHTQVVLNPDVDSLSRFEKIEELIYDKTNMKFNIESGTHLVCDNDGCFLVKERVDNDD